MLTLLLACAAALTAPPPHARAEPVTVAVTELPSGAAEVTVRTMRFRGSAALIRLLGPSEEGSCNPLDPVTRQLDLRDSYDAAREALPGGRASSGAWSMADSEGARTYTAVISPARIRQQLARPPPPIQGAVAGGSARASVYACVYRVSGRGSAIEVYGETRPPAQVLARSGPGAPDVDVSAYVEPQLLGGALAVRAVISSASDPQCRRTRLEHAASRVGGGVAGAADATAVAGPKGSCELDVTVPVPAADRSAARVLDLVSRFLVVVDGDQKKKNAAPPPEILAHFLVPISSRAPPAQVVARAEPPALEAAPPPPPPPPARLRVSVRSGGKVTSEGSTLRRRARTADEEPAVDVISAKLYDDTPSCVTLGLPDAAKGSNATRGARVYVESAVLNTCTKRRAGGECVDRSTLQIARDGAISGDVAKFAGGKLTADDEAIETEVCFVPQVGMADCALEIRWSIRTNHAAQAAAREAVARAQTGDADKNKKKNNAEARGFPHWPMPPEPPHPPPPPPHVDNQYELAEWCLAHDDNCTGIIVIETIVECAGSAHFSPSMGACVGGRPGGYSPAKLLLPGLFVIFLIIIGIVACAVAVRSAHRHDHPG